jgi:hypothetical protein|nr:hypothetical protein [uncultured Actinomyces sp.]
MSDTIVITLCLAGLWVLLLGLLLVEMRSDSWIGVAWRNADVTSQVSKNVRAVCIPALICLCYMVLYVKAAASWGASDRALFGLNALTYVTAAVMVAGLTPLRFPDDWYPQYPDSFSEQWHGDGSEGKT